MAGLELPGFRFHPTEEELLDFYLKRVVLGDKLHYDIIGFLNIYRHDPWDLPGLAKIGEREWYFFVPRDTKHGHGGRPNRTTENGFWKATGSDRTIRCLTDPKKILGLRKTLVFYMGRAPRGTKTDWVMNEYRMPPNSTLPKVDIVLCKIYRKATSLKVLEKRAAMEEEEDEEEMKSTSVHQHVSSPTVEINNSMTPVSSDEDNYMTSSEDVNIYMMNTPGEEEDEEQETVKEDDKKEVVIPMNDKKEIGGGCSVMTKPPLIEKVGGGGLVNDKFLPELQLPGNKIMNMDWVVQDPNWNLSPWLGNWTPTYVNLLLN